jgi:PAS domain S-box-containing protein
MRIKSQLLVLVLVMLLITTALVGGVQAYTAYRQVCNSVDEQLQKQADQFAAGMNAWFDQMMQLGDYFVAQPQLQKADSNVAQRLLANMYYNVGGFEQLVLYRPDGTVFSCYPANGQILKKTVGGERYFQNTIHRKTAQISNNLIRGADGRLFVAITHPVFDNRGHVILVFEQDIDPEYLHSMAGDVIAGQTGKTDIFLSDGKALASGIGYAQRTLVPGMPEKIMKSFRGSLPSSGEYADRHGGVYLYAVSRIKASNWGVALTVAKQEVANTFYESVQYAGGVLVVLLLVIAGIAYILFQRLFRPITVVTEQILKMKDGNFDLILLDEVIEQLAPGEMKNLCATFRQMAQTIKKNMDDLNQANQALRCSEQRWQLALQGSKDGIWDWDILNDRLFYSQQMKDLLGYKDEELKGRFSAVLEAIHPDDRERVEKEFHRHLSGQSTFYGSEHRLRCKDGYKWVYVRGSALWNDFGIPVRMTGSITDITNRKQAEESLHMLNERLEAKVEQRTQELMAMNEELQAMNYELQQSNDTLANEIAERKRVEEDFATTNRQLQKTLNHLNKTQEQLIRSEKMASLGGLVAGVAHEINTPVGVGVTAATHLEKMTKEIKRIYEQGSLTKKRMADFFEDSAEAVSILLTNLDRASRLVKSFKQVSADQSSEMRRTFKVKEYINEVLLSLQPKLKKCKHQISVQGEEDFVLDSYPGGFAQIITNLLLNSLIHAYDEDGQGRIVIEFGQENSRFVLRYSDDGRGMKPAVVNKIFDPFFTTKRGAGGTGLGLYVVYNIVVQQFGGTIDCMSQIGEGTTFTIQFPLC